MHNLIRTQHVVPALLASLFCCFAILLISRLVSSDDEYAGVTMMTDESIVPRSEFLDVAPEDVFVVVENPPRIVGGIASIASRIQYPDLARRAGIEGRVTVQFIVDTDGTVRDTRVLRGIGAGCDEEALRVISETTFGPGLQRGHAVKVRMAIPVQFRLDA